MGNAETPLILCENVSGQPVEEQRRKRFSRSECRHLHASITRPTRTSPLIGRSIIGWFGRRNDDDIEERANDEDVTPDVILEDVMRSIICSICRSRRSEWK